MARGGLRRAVGGDGGGAGGAVRCSAGGASYAAVTLPANSVGAAQLKTFAVTNPKLGTNAVGSRKIKPGAVGFYRVNRNEVQLRVTRHLRDRPGDELGQRQRQRHLRGDRPE